ncbi:MAG TPA: hypothetical protein VFS14_03230 [Candidatus Saccharimonadales bacterium]|nr:hypothetical protein [Candidatus Saccharimonadales bacterium]
MLVLHRRFNQQKRQVIAAIIATLCAILLTYSYSSTVGTPADCTTSQPKRAGLANSNSPQLKKLAEYEAVCHSAVTAQMSFFVPTPTTNESAVTYAADVATQLREFAKYNVTPLVFFEPANENGPINLVSYSTGKYDRALDTYFAALKKAGITDTMMGTWVPIPEGNLPEWTNVDPAVFSAGVTRAIKIQKKHFPKSKASLLLDTTTYTEPGNYSNGRAVSLLPFIRGIPPGLVDSFGLQGFPWSPPAYDTSPTNGRPKDYLRVGLAAETARSLGIKDIWLNSGTFSSMYAGQAGQVTITPAQRLSLLNDIVAQIKSLQAQGFHVAMHLFAEDKSASAEGTNWSYWPTGGYATSPSTYAFRTFAHTLQENHVPLWLFDTIK